jgi:hypothetical protein
MLKKLCFVALFVFPLGCQKPAENKPRPSDSNSTSAIQAPAPANLLAAVTQTGDLL